VNKAGKHRPSEKATNSRDEEVLVKEDDCFVFAKEAADFSLVHSLISSFSNLWH
jgi:hypothetical protein